MADRRVPPGCVGIYTSEDGHVVASASDFKRDGYGGHTLYESQEIRVRRALACAVVRAYCSDAIVDALDGYECEQIMRKLKGRMTFVPVGHPEAERANG